MSVYAISDIHGNLEAFKKIYDNLKDNDIVYCLGDCIDRGRDGWEILKTVLKDSRFIMLKGNHEDMMVEAMKWVWHNEQSQIYNGAFEIWMHNGGVYTMAALKDDPEAKEIIKIVENLPYTKSYKNKYGKTIYMTHSGITDIDYYNRLRTPSNFDMLWDREHFYNTVWQGNDDEFVVHGHTPVPHLVRELDTELAEIAPVRYCEGHKIDIDCGTIRSGIVGLIDLDEEI